MRREGDMIHTAIGAILCWFARSLDDATPEVLLHSFFRRRLADCLATDLSSRQGAGRGGSVQHVLWETTVAAVGAGLLDKLPADCPSRFESATDLLHDARDWAERLPDSKVVIRGAIMPGTGRYLDALSADALDSSEFVKGAFESLLRHVEIRRRRSLNLDQHDTGYDISGHVDRWIERHCVAVALSRYATRTGDVRFLNASLKLNDWAFPSHRKIAVSPRLVHFLRSIAEQERAARTLLWEMEVKRCCA